MAASLSAFVQFVRWLSWAFNLASITNSILPLIAFGVTSNWKKVFDCFGGETLVIDLVASYFKTWMFLFMLGLDKETLFIIFDSTVCQYIEVCLTGASLFFFWSFKSHHGQDETAARSSLILLGLFLIGIGFSFLGMVSGWLIPSDVLPYYLAVFLLSRATQMLFPVYVRVRYTDMVNDEPLVFYIKILSTAFGFFTSTYDAWNFGTQKFADGERKTFLLVVCIFCAGTSFLQGVLRMYGPEKIAQRYQEFRSKIGRAERQHACLERAEI